MINKSVKKLDAKALTLGKPVYTDDLANVKNVLIVKVLRSPHAFAKILEIDTSIALKLKGIVAIYTHKDTPKHRYTATGKSFPEASPYDRRILDSTVRYVGDEVAIIAAENEKTANKALKLIKVKYEVMEPVFNAAEAIGSKVVIHPEEEEITMPDNQGLDVKNNIVSTHEISKGNFQEVFDECDVTLERTYNTQAQAHCMMETHRAYSYLDEHQRIVIYSSTQTAYHTRRQVARALGIAPSKVRVIKPRIGGGFGGKVSCLVEPLVAFVTYKTGRAAKLVLTRHETFSATNTRHSMHINVKLGANKEGRLKCVDLNVISNTGAYGEDGHPVTLVSAHNVLPMYNRAEAMHFLGKTVYTNIVPGAALRGYGATQSTFAIQAAINELAGKLNMSPIEFNMINSAVKGDKGGILSNEIKSCNLEKCIKRGMELIGWDKKYPRYEETDETVKAVGMAVAMHGSSIANVDKGAVTIRLEEDGTYLLLSGSADVGTGSDTILAQIASEALNTSMDNVNVQTGDTDSCPYDTGAYASCTTYITGNATIKAAEKLTEKILEAAGKKLDEQIENLELLSDRVVVIGNKEKFKLLSDIGMESMFGTNEILIATETFGSTVSPQPFVAGFADIEINKESGKADILQYVAVIDCGTVINPNLARIQAEGGLAQGIGLALFEEVHRDKKGKLITDSFMQYKIPTRNDIKNIKVEFEPSFEPSGPYGAKSIGEVVVHTPSPAIQNAIYNAVGVHLRDLPMTPERIFMEMQKVKKK